MRATMQDAPLTITGVLRHGRALYGTSEVVTCEDQGTRRATFETVTDRAERLAAALARLGIHPGDRVGTLAWNTQEHLEAYLAIPSMGAVLHTVNIRLFAEQLTYVVNHAADRVLLVEASLLPVFEPLASECETVEHVIVVGGTEDDVTRISGALDYEELLAAEEPGYEWPDIDERDAAGACYTSGTTGDPKGVVYSHRSTVLHSMGVLSAGVVGLTDRDRVLPIVPMFHANAWGLPYAGWLAGSDFVMPGRYLQAEPLCRLIEEERPTVSGAVPTVWTDVARHAESHPVDLGSLRLVVCGGSAVPRGLIERFDRLGVRIVQGWGMTETSPIAAVAHPPRGTPAEEDLDWRAKTGRVIAGVEMRIVDDSGAALPWDGEAVGEIEVRGPWVTGSYHLESAPEKFDDGWLRTGDVGSIDPRGFVQITDRAKDVIKSGGEWISSVELENHLMAHPEIVEAAVVGVPDERWQERPLACVVVEEGANLDPDALRAFLSERVARWWLPERWAFVDTVPKTSVGKFDKKVLRSQYATGELDAVTTDSDG